jgi:hypothetical protein
MTSFKYVSTGKKLTPDELAEKIIRAAEALKTSGPFMTTGNLSGGIAGRHWEAKGMVRK